MADNPMEPRDDGRLGFSQVTAGVNKEPPPNVHLTEKPKRLGVNDGKKSEADDAKLLERMRKRFDRCESTEADNRERMAQALKFRALKQWSESEAKQRADDGRPCLTVDRLGPLIRQVVNEQRMNRPSIHINPVGDRSDKEAAKLFRGLIRAIERESSADIAYDTAFECAVGQGLGYILLATEWADEHSMDQTIVIRRVRNAFSIYMDPDCKEPDGADAKFAFVVEDMPRDEFEDRYPKAAPVNWSLGSKGATFKDWLTKDHVRIVNYYEVDKDEFDLVELDNGFVGDEDELDAQVKAAIKGGKVEVINRRTSNRRKITCYEANVSEILSRHEWAGNWIPIVPVIGNELDIDGRVRLSGLIEPAMDSARMYNYWVTKYAEAVALAPTAPFIMTEGQMEGHEDEWQNANRTVRSALTYKPESLGGHPAPPPQRQPMPGIPEGFQHGAANAAMDIMATTGIRFDVAGDKRNVDERSGRAIRAFQQPQDLGSAHYMDNFSRSLTHLGRMIVDLIPKTFTTKRIVTILREDDTEQQVEIDPYHKGAAGERQNGQTKMPIFNPMVGKYGVAVTVGPSYATRRMEAADGQMAFAKAFPNEGRLIADLIAKNMDWEGAEEMAARLAKAVPAQYLAPEQKDVSPQMGAYIQGLEGQIKQLGTQLQQAMQGLNEKQSDRAIAQDKIDKDFEAKLIGIIQKASGDASKVAAEEARTHLDAIKTAHAISQSGGGQIQQPQHQPPQEKTDAP